MFFALVITAASATGENNSLIVYSAVPGAEASEQYALAVRPLGSSEPGNKTLFCEMGSDGMTIDADGRIYLTGSKGVYVFDKNGAELGIIEIPETWSANVCIGGADKRTLRGINRSWARPQEAAEAFPAATKFFPLPCVAMLHRRTRRLWQNRKE